MLFVLLSAAGFLSAQDLNMEINGFRVPDYDDKGEMTSQLFGERAEMLGDGEVKITGLRVEFYREGETFLEVRSPYCFYNRDKKEAHSDAPVEADMERVKVRGRGFLLHADDRTVRILNDSKVTIADIMQQTKLKDEEKEKPETVITSKELFLDYAARKVFFEQDVHVQDPQMTMDSGTLEVRFSESNEIDWIEALDNVKIVHEGREAYAGKAVYDVQTDEFVLEDSPKLVDGRNTLMGERIRFWRGDGGRMVCEPSARLVIYPDKQIKTDIFEK